MRYLFLLVFCGCSSNKIIQTNYEEVEIVLIEEDKTIEAEQSVLVLGSYSIVENKEKRRYIIPSKVGEIGDKFIVDTYSLDESGSSYYARPYWRSR